MEPPSTRPPAGPRPPRLAAGILLAVLVTALASCSGSHGILAPKGPEAGRVSALGWGMIIVSTTITLVVFGLLVAAILPGTRHRLRRVGERGYVLVGGIIMPTVVLLTLSGLTVFTISRTQDSGTTDLTVVGHQYWWEVRYPGSDAVTANEIHIPAGKKVRLALRSDDVIHSFWVPALAGKVDMIPGRTNHLILQADHPGRYRGQCAEFCGAQHARMAFVVVAQEPAAYRRWLDHQARPASPAPGTASGETAFENQTCAGCHTIRGTSAQGTVGPDLTHLADRSTIAALTLPNDQAHLRAWIADPQRFKDGAKMPPSVLTDDELTAITRYLAGLR